MLKYEYLDLVAVSIASDLVKITGENRVLAHFGLKKVAENPQAGLKALLDQRSIKPTDYDDWRKIEESEIGRARPGSPREKFVRHHDWLKILGH